MLLKTKGLFRIVLLAVLLVFWWGYRLFSQNARPLWSDLLPVAEWTKFGEILVLEWIIELHDDIMQYTHILKIDNRTYGLKSKTLSLFDYTGRIKVQWTLVDSIDDVQIIDVTEVIAIEEQRSPLDYNQQFFYYPEFGVALDLLGAKWYEAMSDERFITLYDRINNKEVLKIQSFVCSQLDVLKDCAQLLKDAREWWYTSIKQSSWLVSYLLPETATWIVILEDKQIWYYLTADDEAIVRVFFDAMYFFDILDIKNIILDQLWTCEWLVFTTTWEVQIWLDFTDPWKAMARVQWYDKDNNPGECVYDVKIDTTIAVQLRNAWKQIKNIEDNKDWSIIDSIVEITPEEEISTGSIKSSTWEDTSLQLQTWDIRYEDFINEDRNSNITGEAIKYLWRLKHSSARWYDIFYSTHKIRFYGEMVDIVNAFGITGLQCRYRFNINPYQADSLADPDVVLYECKGSVSQEQLVWKNISLVATTDTAVFILDRQSDLLDDLDVSIEMKQE